MTDRKLQKSLLWDRMEKKECPLCNKPLEFKRATIDHKIPKSEGGSNALINKQLVHRGCNRAKGSTMPDKYSNSQFKNGNR